MRRIILFVAPLIVVIVYLGVKAALIRGHLTGFGSDPCDAVNATAIIASFVAVVRGSTLLFPRRASKRSDDAYTVSATVVLAMSVSFVTEVITILRRLHSLPMSRGYVTLLLVFEGCVVATALAALVWSRNNSEITGSPITLAVCSSLAIVILFFCPEWPSASSAQLWHFATVVLGGVILLVLVRQSLYLLSAQGLPSFRPTWLEGTGALLGACLLFYVICMSSQSRAMLAVSIVGEFLLICAFLARPLGFYPATE